MTDRKSHLDSLAVASLLLCCALWGLGQVATKLTLAEVPPLAQAAFRSLGAALLVALYARWRGIPLWQRDGTLRGGLLAGALFAAEFACIFIGLQHTSASRMVVFIYLAPFIVALGMPVVAGSERPSGVQLAGLALAFAGVAWAFAEGFVAPRAGARQWLGDSLGVAAAVLWASTTLTIRGSRLSSAAPEKTLMYQLLVSGLALAVGSWAAGETLPQRVGAGTAGLLFFQTVVICFASYLLWFWLVRHYPATSVSSFTLFTPIFGLLAGVALLDEPLTLRLGAAAGTVALGIALVNRPRRPALSPTRQAQPVRAP